jgi:hypothetical protein
VVDKINRKLGYPPMQTPGDVEKLTIDAVDKKVQQIQQFILRELVPIVEKLRLAVGGILDGFIQTPDVSYLDQIAVFGADNSLLGGGYSVDQLITLLRPKAANVNVDETQPNNVGYLPLATVGPSVSMETGSEVIITLSATAYRTLGAAFTMYISVAVSGVTAIAAIDDNGISAASTGANSSLVLVRRFLLSGLNPGVNVFEMQYKNDGGGVWHVDQRSIVVERLN